MLIFALHSVFGDASNVRSVCHPAVTIRFGSCRRYADSLTICDHGLRTRRYHCLSGSVLSIWNILEAVLGSAGSSNMAKLQVIRLKIGDEKIVGRCLVVCANVAVALW